MQHKRKLELNELLGKDYAHIVGAYFVAITAPILGILLWAAASFSVGCYSGLGLLFISVLLLLVREPRGTADVIAVTKSLYMENQMLHPPSMRKLSKLCADWGGRVDNFLGYHDHLWSEYEKLLPPKELRV